MGTNRAAQYHQQGQFVGNVPDNAHSPAMALADDEGLFWGTGIWDTESNDFEAPSKVEDPWRTWESKVQSNTFRPTTVDMKEFLEVDAAAPASSLGANVHYGQLHCSWQPHPATAAQRYPPLQFAQHTYDDDCGLYNLQGPTTVQTNVNGTNAIRPALRVETSFGSMTGLADPTLFSTTCEVDNINGGVWGSMGSRGTHSFHSETDSSWNSFSSQYMSPPSGNGSNSCMPFTSDLPALGPKTEDQCNPQWHGLPLSVADLSGSEWPRFGTPSPLLYSASPDERCSQSTFDGTEAMPPPYWAPSTMQLARSATPETSRPRRRSSKDRFLIDAKRAGKSYKQIRREGNFREAESTLRGRFRSLTKDRKERVRKPVWTSNDIRLLREAVEELTEGNISKTPWKKVAEYIADNGGSYHFGNSTCKKKFLEIEP